tara:strand:- start:244 stop:549 length:306 start_codon:yes stop_codon:yes gene_type:complete
MFKNVRLIYKNGKKNNVYTFILSITLAFLILLVRTKHGYFWFINLFGKAQSIVFFTLIYIVIVPISLFSLVVTGQLHLKNKAQAITFKLLASNFGSDKNIY